MRRYTLTDLFYREGIKNDVIASTAVNSVKVLPITSKELFLRNDGPNDVFLEFDGAVAAVATGFKLKVADGLVRVEAQCSQIAAICNTAETASVRVGINF